MVKTNETSFIDKLYQKNSIYLYGAGNVGKEVLKLLTDQGIVINSFLDKKKSIDFVDGIPVILPNDVTIESIEKENALVVLSFFNAYVSVPEIIDYLKGLGWKNIITFLELHKKFSNELGNRFWLTNQGFYDDKSTLIQMGAELWSDSKSKVLYNSIIEFRLSHEYSKLSEPEFDKQYFPEDVPSWVYPLNFVDCGAFDGDTLREMQRQDIKTNKIAAFEPDLANFKTLAANCNKLEKEIILYPCGVWSSSTQLRFNSGSGTGSALSKEGNTVIQCVSIDESLINFEPNLIKMDIEGAEYASLLGAKKTIMKYRPGLAICLYHNPEHIWQIPLLIKSWNLNYTFFLRCHCYSTFDLVMYAIPNT